jgi:cobalt-zinc-cadmium efflux system outer membrane protein
MVPARFLALLLLAGCGSALEAEVRRDLDAATAALDEAPGALDGTLGAVVEAAMVRNPELRAAHGRWQAAVQRIDGARALPDPTVTYAFYARPVETRVGPQRHRVGARQAFPWPGRLAAAAGAQAARARAAQRAFEARALALRAEVAAVWWRRWRARRAADTLAEQGTLLEGLAEVLRARVATGAADVSEVAQIELRQARLADRVAALEEEGRVAEAALFALVGAAADAGEAPPPALPDEAPEALADDARRHPRLTAFEAQAEAAERRADAADARRLPSISLGLDWIETAPGASTGADAGQDAVIAAASLSMPLWQQGAYADAAEAARIEARATRDEGRGAVDRAVAELTAALSAVRDSHRRLRLLEGTLLPSAQSAYESVLGAYTAGRGAVAAVLLAQRDLSELAVDRIAVRADHGRAWARLEAVVGRPVLRSTDG